MNFLFKILYYLIYIVDDVKFGAIKNLAKFLEVFSNEKREHFVDVFLNLQVIFFFFSKNDFIISLNYFTL